MPGLWTFLLLCNLYFKIDLSSTKHQQQYGKKFSSGDNSMPCLEKNKQNIFLDETINTTKCWPREKLIWRESTSFLRPVFVLWWKMSSWQGTTVWCIIIWDLIMCQCAMIQVETYEQAILIKLANCKLLQKFSFQYSSNFMKNF